jgi:hypothetical protein
MASEVLYRSPIKDAADMTSALDTITSSSSS